MRFCPYCERVRLVLEHKRIPYDLVYVALKDSAPSWLRDRQPCGSVPVLEKDGKILYDSLVLLHYLDETRTRNRLLPTDPFLKASQSMNIANFEKVSKAYHSVTDKLYEDKAKVKCDDVTDKDKSDEVKPWDKLLNELDRFEKMLRQADEPYFGGSNPGMMDFIAWPVVERFPALERINPEHVFGPLSRFPYLLAWQRKMLLLPAVQECLIDAETHAVAIKASAAKKPDYCYGLS
jgi:glutathione S-transferase